MSFLEKIKEMGYELKDNEFNKIQIEKETKYSIFTVIFDMDEKYINACLQPKFLINSSAAISMISLEWNDLTQDLSTFKNLSGYVILYPTGEHL